MFGFGYILIISLLLSQAALASEVVEFPTDELASESVLPIFDQTSVVKSRVIQTEGRIELGIGAGLNLTEALYNNINYNFLGTYHFTETHAAQISAIFVMDGLSSMGQSLKEGKGLGAGQFFDASLAPHPESLIFANYQFTAYYGKISITKKYIMHLSLYGLGGLGLVSFGDATKIGADLGFGQKFYFTKNLALRFDLKVFAYQGPDPTSKLNLNSGTYPAKLSSSDFDQTTFFNTYLTAGLVYLF